MGFLNSLIGIAKSAGIGTTKLEEAKTIAPNSMGCYKIYYNGLKYVGKAEDGLRKRFVQYYNGTTAHYPSAKKIYENRDRILVSWVVLGSGEKCREVEAQWIRELKPEWNKQRGWGD
ncbi:MAG: GIY-YIG nuclease family protein [Candidatus Cloacimonadales bacterium]|nr:GIY-YIG nuclease family protein [Candidatus Cloacimonadota bacterium]MDD2650112.1 GIY-YIG nuclease family protein [Candidatus Cloacimonadota bacterium]MDX9978137.1 GIY-YIG nuclease family protein [Candidatus Cloacimonadales bacterium]